MLQKRSLISIGILFVCAALFQNCGRIGFNAEFDSGGSLASLGFSACNQLLKQTYSKSYFPVLSVSCNRCHSTGQGSKSLDVSFAGFMSKGVDLIDYKATHSHGDNGVNISAQIPSIRKQWDEGQSDFATCVASASSGDDNLGFRIKLNEKVIPNLQNTLTNQNQWASVEWDLDSEGSSNISTKFGAFLKIEARYFLQQKSVMGLEFRNPTLRLKEAGKYVQVSGLRFFLDQTLQTDVTTYDNISAVVSTTTATMLAPGAGTVLVYDPQVVASTMVGLVISNIKFVTDPTQDPGNGG